MSQVLSDYSLSCRLERTEAQANAAFVEAHARLDSSSGAQWIEVAGAYAMYDGPHSPCTQTFGLGLLELPTQDQMRRIEDFFQERRALVYHEISPLARKELWPMLHQRGYRPLEFTSVMYLPLPAGRQVEAARPGLEVRVAGEHERELWARTAAEGWREFTEFAGVMRDLLQVSAARSGGVLFLVESQRQAIASAALSIHDGVALFAGASTLPEWRRRGAQQLLLDYRLQRAAEAGCDLAMMCAEPGSASQRNAERRGFRIAYTRIKWVREASQNL